MEILPGSLVGNWLIEATRTRGDLAQTFRARHVTDGRAAAITVDRAPRSSAGYFARIAHPGIARVLDEGVLDDGRAWLAVEWLDGQPLADELRRRGPFPIREAVAIVEQLAAALTAAHASGVGHGDVTVANVLLVPDGARARAKLMCDAAAAVQSFDHRDDLRALGALLFELLTGQAPYQAPSRVSDHVPVPSALDAIVARCLSNEYRDAAALHEDLRGLRAPLVAARAELSIEARIEQRDPASAATDDAHDDADEAIATAHAACAAAGLDLVVSSGMTVIAAGPARRLEALAANLAQSLLISRHPDVTLVIRCQRR